MPKQQTKYCKQWESSRPWLKPGWNKYLGRCTFCNKEFQVGGTDVIQVDSYARSDGHKVKIPGNSQRTLCSTWSGQLLTSGENEVELSPAMHGLHAEIIETLHKVEYNQSFASATNDGDRFWLMFSNHPASEHYHCSSTKSSYLLRYDIAEVLF